MKTKRLKGKTRILQSPTKKIGGQICRQSVFVCLFYCYVLCSSPFSKVKDWRNAFGQGKRDSFNQTEENTQTLGLPDSENWKQSIIQHYLIACHLYMLGKCQQFTPVSLFSLLNSVGYSKYPLDTFELFISEPTHLQHC